MTFRLNNNKRLMIRRIISRVMRDKINMREKDNNGKMVNSNNNKNNSNSNNNRHRLSIVEKSKLMNKNKGSKDKIVMIVICDSEYKINLKLI